MRRVCDGLGWCEIESGGCEESGYGEASVAVEESLSLSMWLAGGSSCEVGVSVSVVQLMAAGAIAANLHASLRVTNGVGVDGVRLDSLMADDHSWKMLKLHQKKKWKAGVISLTDQMIQMGQ